MMDHCQLTDLPVRKIPEVWSMAGNGNIPAQPQCLGHTVFVGTAGRALSCPELGARGA